MSTVSPRVSEPRNPGNISPRGMRDATTPAPTGSRYGDTSPRSSSGLASGSNSARAASPRSTAYGSAPRGASPFVRPRTGNRPPLNPSGAVPGGKRPPRMQESISPREEPEEENPLAKTAPADYSRGSPPSADNLSAAAAIAVAKGEHGGSIDQAHAMIRVLAAQADEARADKTAMWEQTRNDARAMAQVAKNIEGNQGVLAKVVTTLESQLVAARTEKDAALEAGRADKKTWERLLRESERQLREVEKQRDRAQATAVESNTSRKQAQEALETSRRNDMEVVRAVQAEKTAMARELKELRAAQQEGAQRSGAASGELARLAESFESLQAALGVGEYAAGGGQPTAAEALREARAARDEAESAKEALRAELRAELLSAVEAREEALAELAAARAGHAPETHRLGAELEATGRELQREREAAERLRSELEASNGAREKLLVQARLDGAALSSREREYSQQLNAKEAQVSALERELATMAGQLVGAQAETRALKEAAASAEAATLRERAALMQAHEALDADKASLQAQLKTSDEQRADLAETVAQCGADRDFCYEVIKELKGKLERAQQERGGA